MLVVLDAGYEKRTCHESHLFVICFVEADSAGIL